MVTIKIQSREDIISAYLKSLGFEEAAATENSRKASVYIGENQESGDGIIEAFDKLLATSAHKIWPLSPYDEEQATALFKLNYLLNDGAKRWGLKIFNPASLPAEMVTIFAQQKLCQAPEYAFSQMAPQKIEPAVAKHWLHRLLHFSFKKA